MKTTAMSTLMVATLAGAAIADVEQTTSRDEIRALVAEMMSDADGRTSLLGGGADDGHFTLTDSAGNFSLQLSGQVLTRYTMNFRDDDTAGDDDYEGGFTAQRTELAFSGHVFEPGLQYRVSGNFDRDGGLFNLEDAYVVYGLEDGWAVAWGQVRLPVLWEDVISDKYSLAADRSVMNQVFGPDRSQAIWTQYSNDDFRFWLAFGDGVNSDNTEFNASPADYAFTLRTEFKFSGDWGQFGTFSSPQGSESAAKLGLAAHWQDGPDRAGAVETELLAYTADFMYQADGWNAYAAFVGLSLDPDGGEKTDDYGFMVQGGAFVAEDWELFGRYDVIMPDDDRAGDSEFNTITAGVNYYMHGQAAKFTFDVQWFLDATTENDLVAATNTDRVSLLPSDEDDQFALRFQFQLLF